MDKSRFTNDPHLDSEGFVQADARCFGCKPDEPCSRSGSCERYDSPLRNPKGWNEVDGVALPSVRPWADLSDAELAQEHDRLTRDSILA